MKELSFKGFSKIDENELISTNGGYSEVLLITIGICAALAGIVIGYKAYEEGKTDLPSLG